MSAHKFCAHPATKAERAKCRRQTEKGLSGVRVETVPAIQTIAEYAADRLGWDIHTLPLTDDNVLELRGLLVLDPMISDEERAALTSQLTNPQPAENEYARMCREIEEARNAKKGQTVTRETWREFRDLDVEIEYEVWGSQPNHQLVGRLVAWGASRLSYVSKAGKRNTIDVTRVLSVRAVLDQD